MWIMTMKNQKGALKERKLEVNIKNKGKENEMWNSQLHISWIQQSSILHQLNNKTYKWYVIIRSHHNSPKCTHYIFFPS